MMYYLTEELMSNFSGIILIGFLKKRCGLVHEVSGSALVHSLVFLVPRQSISG